MIITAKFASSCPCCGLAIKPGAKVNWAPGTKASHVSCGGATSAHNAVAVSGRSTQSRRGYSARAGKWNGCACGAREMDDGSLSANACASCRYDNE